MSHRFFTDNVCFYINKASYMSYHIYLQFKCFSSLNQPSGPIQSISLNVQMLLSMSPLMNYCLNVFLPPFKKKCTSKKSIAKRFLREKLRKRSCIRFCNFQNFSKTFKRLISHKISIVHSTKQPYTYHLPPHTHQKILV